MLEFMKLYADMEQLFEPFSMEERGRLLTAMMEYCFEGIEPEFTGNERYIWPVLRRHFDQCSAANEKNAANGAKGGRPKNPEKPNETQKNPEKPNKTQRNPEKAIQEQEHIQEQEQEHIQEQEQVYTARAREAAPDDGKVIGIDGNDLREDIERNQIADTLIARFRLSRDDVTREALLADLAQYGETRMREVLTEAASSNTRERVSLKYWRAILAGKGRDSPPKNSGVNYGEVMRQRQYDDDYWKSIEVNLEDE